MTQTIAILLTLAVTGSGCSLALMERVPDDYSPKRADPVCSNSPALAVVDGLIAAGSIGGGLLSYSLTSDAAAALDDKGLNDYRKLYLGAEIGVGVVYLLSALSGASGVRKCDRAHAAREVALEERNKEAEMRASEAPIVPASLPIDAGVPLIDALEDDGAIDASSFTVEPAEPLVQ